LAALEESSSDVAEAAKGLATSFVATLGLLDIILGGLALYCYRLLSGRQIESRFPSTGFASVDVALLACGAALAGKLIYLLVSGFIMGAVEWLWSHTNQKRLADAVAAYCRTTKRNTAAVTVAPMDLAVAYLAFDVPPLAQSLDQIRTAAHFAYGASILCAPFYYYMRDQLGAWWFVGGGALFFFLGLLQQLDYYENVVASLLAARVTPERGTKRGATNHGD
jgi:hypothetical protein